MAAARSQTAASVVVGLVVAAACLSILLTVGRTAAAEQAVLACIDELGVAADAESDGAGSGRPRD